MSGQSANLTISEAKAMMKRTEQKPPGVGHHHGPANSSVTETETMKKIPHQRKKG